MESEAGSNVQLLPVIHLKEEEEEEEEEGAGGEGEGDDSEPPFRGSSDRLAHGATGGNRWKDQSPTPQPLKHGESRFFSPLAMSEIHDMATVQRYPPLYSSKIGMCVGVLKIFHGYVGCRIIWERFPCERV
ncbi:hypothetical protein EYF80_044356 [Liparis tanakae]|uniref:Uncharacterized protein n=1 Tax=Liparis tanakae TaxID=230148 RepID=A0A4Z2FWY3_9TELE|nr:hypothetical protein EYF80_044356 [Liparis tanakae]